VAIKNILPMKVICFSILIILLVNLKIFSQEEDSSRIIIDPIEEMPVFPGGIDSIWCYIENNLRYDIINSDSESVRYIIRFVIDTVGRTRDFEFISTIPRSKVTRNDSLKKIEILRVLSLLPLWEPARLNNIKVPCRYMIPINTPAFFRCKNFIVNGEIEQQPDRLAMFKGIGTTNQERISNYLVNNLRWIPEPECNGRVIIKCVVEKDGELSNFQFLRKLCPEHDQEALRVLEEMPPWEPARKNGKIVRSYVVIPLTFRLK
jgi:hypothetical protein